METQGSTQEPVRSKTVEGSSTMVGKAYCKCGEGWTCTITRTEGPDAGKVFFKCGENCSCDIDDSPAEAKSILQKSLDKVYGVAYCKCGEGWTCVISKSEGPDSGKAFYDCAGSCTCTIGV